MLSYLRLAESAVRADPFKGTGARRLDGRRGVVAVASSPLNPVAARNSASVVVDTPVEGPYAMIARLQAENADLRQQLADRKRTLALQAFNDALHACVAIQPARLTSQDPASQPGHIAAAVSSAPDATTGRPARSVSPGAAVLSTGLEGLGIGHGAEDGMDVE